MRMRGDSTCSRRPSGVRIPVVVMMLALFTVGCSRTGGADLATAPPPTTVPVQQLPTLREAPAGFSLQDYLDVRVAVPNDWLMRVPHGISCGRADEPNTSAVSPSTILALGDDTPPCGKWQAIEVKPYERGSLTDAHLGSVGLDGSLRAEIKGLDCVGCFLEVGLIDLGVSVSVGHGDATTRQMLSLLSASPRYQVLSDGPAADTTSWQSVALGSHLSAKVPAAWLPPTDFTTSPAVDEHEGCGFPFIAGPRVLLGIPPSPPPDTGGVAVVPQVCVPPTPTVPGVNQSGPTFVPGDGIWAGGPHPDTQASLAPGTTFPPVKTSTRSVNGRRVEIPADDYGDADAGLVQYFAPASTVHSIYVTTLVAVDTSNGPMWLRIGLGPDPKIARAVIASLVTT